MKSLNNLYKYRLFVKITDTYTDLAFKKFLSNKWNVVRIQHKMPWIIQEFDYSSISFICSDDWKLTVICNNSE
jgi:hypothetical protein